MLPKPNGVESEQSLEVSFDFNDVASDIVDISSAPPSPGLLKNIGKGTLGAVVKGQEGRMLDSILVPCALSLLL